MARAKTRRVKIGTVGIDTAQLYLGEPCYVIDTEIGKSDWGEFLDKLQPEDALWWTVMGKIGTREFPAGMVVKTGYGDGEYPVEVTLNKEGRVASVTITFIREDD